MAVSWHRGLPDQRACCSIQRAVCLNGRVCFGIHCMPAHQPPHPRRQRFIALCLFLLQKTLMRCSSALLYTHSSGPRDCDTWVFRYPCVGETLQESQKNPYLGTPKLTCNPASEHGCQPGWLLSLNLAGCHPDR